MSMFANAKSLKTPKASKATSDKVEVKMPGLLQFCQLEAAIGSLQTISDSVKADLKLQAADVFEGVVEETNKRPESFRGVEGEASASVEMRKRATTSKLADNEVEALEAAGITIESKVTTQFLYGINPTHAGNAELLKKVEAALKKIVPEDFFVVQEEVSSKVVGDTTYDEVCKHKNAAQLLPFVTVLALKPSLKDPDVPAILKNITKLLSVPAKKAKKD